MAIAEHAMRRATPTESGARSEQSLNKGVISAYYDARSMLGIAGSQHRNGGDLLTSVAIDGGNRERFITVEGPDVTGLIVGLRDKLIDLDKNPAARRSVRGARRAVKERQRAEKVLSVLEENSTNETGPVTFWDLGNRSEVPGYRAQRTMREAYNLESRDGNTHNATEYLSRAAASLSQRRELILSSDPDFYKVNVPGMDIEPFSGGASGPGNEENGDQMGDNHTANDYQDEARLEEPEVLTATEVPGQRPRRRTRTRQVTVNRRPIAAASAVLLALGIPTGLEATGRIDVLQSLRNRGAVTRTVAPPDNIEIGSTITVTPPIPSSTSTSVEQKATTTTTVPSVPEIAKSVDPVGVAWLSDTMNPWKEQIAKESKKYGLDPAIPAILVQIKTAGDYTFHNQDYTGLFELSNDVINEGMLALYGGKVDNPTLAGLDASKNIAIGVWNIARNKDAGSVRKTISAVEGGDGSVSQLVAALVADAKSGTSTQFDDWKKNGGAVVINSAKTILTKQGLI